MDAEWARDIWVTRPRRRPRRACVGREVMRGLFFGVLHELADGVEDEGEAFVVLREFLFQGFQFPAEVFVRCEQLTETDEGPDDFDADANRRGAAEDGREHGDALFSEGIGACAADAS